MECKPCCKYCDVTKKLMVILEDENGNPLPSEQREVLGYDGTTLHLKILNTNTFTHDELLMLGQLLSEKIEYGNNVAVTRSYLELLDKIEEMRNKKTP